jgi:hypothetical protein
MNLDEAQKKQVAAWIEAGLKIAEIQKKLESEFSLRATYLDTRLLIDDLKLRPKDPELPKVAAPPAPAKEAAVPPPAPAPAPAPGGVSVTVDQIARPGALVSGGVKFSDGQAAKWYLDETGRLGLQPQQEGYKPAAADIQAFQRELQGQLQRMGF